VLHVVRLDLLTGFGAKTRKTKHTGRVNKERKMTSRKQCVKNHLVISAQENAYDEKKSSLNQGGYF
jgi:hypothetical protein